MDALAQVVCFSVFILAVFLFVANELFKHIFAFRRIAREHDAKLTCKTSWFLDPGIQFQHHGVPTTVAVDAPLDGNASFMRFQIGWPQNHFRCEIVPNHFQRRLTLFRDTREVELGLREFDRKYAVQANLDSMVREVLSEEVRELIGEFRKLSTVGDVYILWSNGSLILKIQGNLRGFTRLREFIQLGLQFFDAAVATQSQGIDYLISTKAVRGPSPTDEVICLICGEAIEEETIYCQSCRTPHHKDCWEYYGACSTYGCGQTEFSNTG